MKKKSLVSLLAAVSLVAVVGVGSTLAYFTDSDVATNVVTMGHVDIVLTENGQKLIDFVLSTEGQQIVEENKLITIE